MACRRSTTASVTRSDGTGLTQEEIGWLIARRRRHGRAHRRAHRRCRDAALDASAAVPRLAGRAARRRTLAPLVAEQRLPDRRTAAAARPAGGRRPRTAASRQVAGGALLGARGLLSSSIWWARRTSRRRSGTSADRRLGCDAGDEAELGGVHVADAGQVGLVEQRLLTARSGCSARAAHGLARSQSGPSRSGPRWPTSVVLAVAADELDDAEREADRDGARRSSSTTRAVWAGRGQRCAGPEHPPAALHLEVGVQGPAARRASIRVSRCLPRETVSLTVPPVRSAVANWGTRKSVRGQHLAAQRRSSRRAARQTVSPSGTGRPQPQPPRRRDEAGGVERLAQRRRAAAEELLAVGLLDRQPAQRAAAAGLGERLRPPGRAGRRRRSRSAASCRRARRRG